MERDYDYYKQAMEDAAAAYAARCTRIDGERLAALTKENQAHAAQLTALYAVPRSQLTVDLEAMRQIAADVQQIQASYPADSVKLADCLAEVKPRFYADRGCIEAFHECAAQFTAAAQALCSCPVAEDADHLRMMAECLVSAEDMLRNLDALLDVDYHTFDIKADMEQVHEARRDAITAEAEGRKQASCMPEYQAFLELKQALREKADALEAGLLSCRRLSDDSFPQEILLGRMSYVLPEDAQTFWTTQMGLSIDQLAADGFTFPMSPMVSSLILNATAEQIASKELEAMLVTMFLQFVSAFPTKYLHVCGMQGNLSGVICSLVSELASAVGDSIVFGGPKATESAIADGVDAVSALMEERIRFYGRKYADIYDYNARCPETRHPFVLVFIHNYPYAYEERAVRKKVEDLLESGGRCGIFTVLVNCTDAKLERFGEPVPPLDTEHFGSLCVTYADNQCFTAQGHTYRCDIMEPGFSERAFWQQLSDSTRYVSRPIMLDSLLSLDFDRRPYYDELKIPVGRNGNDLQFFRLDVESTGKAAALVAGGTGSGKTTFLHTLILSGATYYSPEELEFYLIDFKDGVEFSNYLKREGEPSAYIPHVSFVSLKNRVEDAYDVLHKIGALKTERNRLFNLAGATDFKTYHQSRKVQNGELPRLKRTIVIIDEYQNMLEPTGNGSAVLAAKCAGRLLGLLKEVRNAGISLVLSSQAICVGREAKDQIFNRIVFSGSENTINSAFETARSAEMMSELQRERGLAYLSEDGGVHAALFKSAWAGKTNGEEHQATAAAICGKWAALPANPMIISGNPKELQIGTGCSALSRCEAAVPDEDMTVYEAVIGQSFLSDEPVAMEFTSGAFSSYVLIGDLPKVRNIEASAALGFLLELTRDGCAPTDAVSYCDINYTSEGRKHRSPLEALAPALSGAVDYLKNESDVADRITALHGLYHTRLEALKKGEDVDMTPRLLIISSVHNVMEFAWEEASAPAEGLSALDQLLMDTTPTGGGRQPEELVRQLTLLYERGFEQHIFVIFSERESQRLRELIPRGIRYERGVYCSKDALAAADWSSGGEHISLDELAENCCVVLPNVSKVRPYTYTDCADWFARYQALLQP